MHFGGNIFTGKTNRLDIVFCGNLIKKQDGEEQKDEPPMNGALNTKSLKEVKKNGKNFTYRKISKADFS